MKKSLIYIISSVFFLTGCISNDIPYPVVVPKVISMTVQDAVDVSINYQTQEIRVSVSETTDLRRVVIQSFEIDHEFAKPSVELLGVHDLTTPLRFSIRTYQDYNWTITAVRPVHRYFNVSGQVGTSTIDEYNCRALAKVAKGTDVSSLEVTAIKLGPKDLTTYSPDPMTLTDFTSGAEVEVTAFDKTEKWTLYVEETDISVQISSINPWAKSAYVQAMAVAGKEILFQYREKDNAEWLDVNPDDITSEGGTFVAHIKNLLPETEYEVTVRSGDESTAPEKFVTSPATKIPNGSFEYASFVRGTNYYKFYDPDCNVEEGMTMFWGSGNGEGPEGVNGSANMGIIITTIDKQTKVDGIQSVCAQTSQMAGILAAGNLFTGQFAGLVGSSGGMVNFGRPWTSRPVAVKMSFKYITSKVDIIGDKLPPAVRLTKNDYDRAQIKIALGVWDYRKYGGTKDSPVHVNTTNESTFVDFNTDPSTVANGELIIHKDSYILNGTDKVDASTAEWAEYIIPLDYHMLDVIPTHIIISCAASQYGDYFTGCSTSKLWIDKVELVY